VVVAQAKRCLLDLVGVAASGIGTELSRIARNHAVRHMAAGERGAASFSTAAARAPPAQLSPAPRPSTPSTPMTATR
jgi:2-methylcitrate dehydratase PrpD